MTTQPNTESLTVGELQDFDATPAFYIDELTANTIKHTALINGKVRFSNKPTSECDVPVYWNRRTEPSPAEVKPATGEDLAIYNRIAANYQAARVEGEAEFKRGVLEGRGDGFSILRDMCVEGIVTSDQLGIFVDRLGGYKSTHPMSDAQQAKDAALEATAEMVDAAHAIVSQSGGYRRELVWPMYRAMIAALSTTKQEG